jgi:D-glycero-D-manno-heptose 1,7-bisphosphate phosphatase
MKAVFLDRDGVLVEEIFYQRTGETEAPLAASDVRLLPGAADAVRSLQQAGYRAIIVSNQGGYAKGKASLRELWLAHERFLALLAAEGVTPDQCFYSWSHPAGVTPHFSGASLDRKPCPYNLLIAAAQFDLDLSLCWMIGDRETDVECGKAAGTRTVRVSKADSKTAADYLEADVPAAARRILLVN